MSKIPEMFDPLLGGNHEAIAAEADILKISFRVLVGERWGLFSRADGLRLTSARLMSLVDRAANVRRNNPNFQQSSLALAGRNKAHTNSGRVIFVPRTTVRRVSEAPLKPESKKPKKGKASITKFAGDWISEKDVFAHGTRIIGSFQSRQ